MIPLLQILPPDLFPPDLQPLVYFTILPTIIGFLLAFDFIFYFFFMPPEAKTHTWNKLWKEPMFDIEDEGGIRTLETGKIRSSGAVELRQSKELVSLGLPLTKGQIEARIPADATQDEISKIIKELRETEKIALRPSIVKGTGARIFRVFRSTAIATSMATLVGLEHDGKSKKSPMLIPILAKNNKRIEPVKLFLRKGEELKNWIADVLIPVDPSIIRKYFDPQFNPTTAKRFYWLGYERGANKGQSSWKKWLIPLLIIGVIVVIAIGAVILLGGSGGGTPQPAPQG